MYVCIYIYIYIMVFNVYIVYMVYIVYAMYAVYRSLPPVVRGGGPESLPRTPPYHWGGGRDHGSRDHIYTYIYCICDRLLAF